MHYLSLWSKEQVREALGSYPDFTKQGFKPASIPGVISRGPIENRSKSIDSTPNQGEQHSITLCGF